VCDKGEDKPVYEDDEPIYHVFPGMEEDHLLIGKSCWCEPTVEFYEDGTVVTHNRRQ
jgi:hypothetical protein